MIDINNIAELVENLKKKIKTYGDKFAENEMLVRYAVVDPLLRALGWELDNPEQVIPEYKTEKGKADYALFIKEKNPLRPVAFIEVKAWSKLNDETLRQTATYAVDEGVNYIVITDGDQWALYDMYKNIPLKDKKVLSWSLLDDDPFEVTFKALSIANTRKFGIKPSEPLFTIVPKPEMEETKPKETKEAFTRKNVQKLILEILANSGKPLTRKEIVEQVREHVKLTEKDLEPVKSGLPRWEANVRWVLTGLAKGGLVESQGKNKWIITEKGRAFLGGKQEKNNTEP
jgi:predicted type IV restriction endonuclease